MHPGLPSALHRLTGGHPLGGHLLCEAVTQASAHRSLDPEQLLDLRTASDRPVTEQLLEELVPPPQIRDLLVWLSPARDREAAQALAAGEAGRGAEPFPAVGAARYLEDELWGGAANRPFVADPFLRTLLLHELRRGAEAAEEPGRRWREVHTALRDHHAGQGEEGEPDVLRHTLACGDADRVVAGLTAHFETWEARRWLEALRYACGAPHPPRSDWQDLRRETARGDRDRELADATEVRRSVNRLLHGLWYAIDAVTDPDAELARDVGRELAFLAMWHPTGHAVLNRAAQEWPERVRERDLGPPSRPGPPR